MSHRRGTSAEDSVRMFSGYRTLLTRACRVKKRVPAVIQQSSPAQSSSRSAPFLDLLAFAFFVCVLRVCVCVCVLRLVGVWQRLPGCCVFPSFSVDYYCSSPSAAVWSIPLCRVLWFQQ